MIVSLCFFVTVMGMLLLPAGDKKLQQLLMTFALMTKGKKPKQVGYWYHNYCLFEML